MSTRHILLSIAVLLAMLGGTPLLAAGQGGAAAGTPPPAGPIPRGADGKPDFTGNWLGSIGVAHTIILEEHPGGFGVTAGKGLIIDPPSGVIPYQPWALVERNRRRDDTNGYEDPGGHCEFYDMGRVHSFDWDIVHRSDLLMITAQVRQVRMIDLTRRQHLPEGIRLWTGDPVARWEGDTLVIDSTNFNGKTRMAIGGDFYTPNAHLVERFTMLDSNTFKWTLTIDDPTVFTRPWTMTSTVPHTRRPVPIDFDREDTCHEGNVDLVHLKNVYDQAREKP